MLQEYNILHQNSFALKNINTNIFFEYIGHTYTS